MTDTATAPAARGFDRDLRRLCAVVVTGAIMTILDTTIVNVAVNTLGVQFHTSLSTIQWVLTGYMLALSMAIPLTGWAVSRFGARTMWLTSLGLFIAGSVLCGASWSVVSLIIFRVIQGFGGGMIMPVGQQMLARAAGPERMGRVMVVVAVPAMLAPVLGPVLGGLIVDHLDWRWMFYVNVPVCALALLLALRFLPREDVDRRPDQRLDILGLMLLSPALAAVVYGLSEAGNGAGFGSTRVLVCLCVGVALLVVFVLHSVRRRAAALVDVRVFRRRAFTAANVGIACYSMAVFGLMMVIPLYAQLVRHDSPLQAGMLLAPLGLGAMATMPLAGRLTDRIGPRWVGVAGVAVAMVGAGMLTGLGVGTSIAVPIVALVVVGLGHGAVIPAISAAGYQGAPREEIPAVTTASNIMLRTASSVGTAVLAVVLQIAIRHRVPGAGGSLAEAARSAATAPALLTDSFSVAYWWALALGVLALPILLLIPPRPRVTTPTAAGPASTTPSGDVRTDRQALPSAE